MCQENVEQLQDFIFLQNKKNKQFEVIRSRLPMHKFKTMLYTNSFITPGSSCNNVDVLTFHDTL